MARTHAARDRHHRHRLLHAQEVALVVHRGGQVEVALGLSLDTGGPEHAGVGDEQVQAAVGTHDLVDQLVDRHLVGDVNTQADRAPLAPLLGQGLGRRLRAHVVDVGHRDVGTLGNKVLRYLQTEPLCRTSHKCHLARDAPGTVAGGRHLPSIGLDLPVLDEPSQSVAKALDPAQACGARHDADRVFVDLAHCVGRRPCVASGEKSESLDQHHVGQHLVLTPILADGVRQALHRVMAGRVLEPQREGLAVDDLVRAERA